jgi:tetrapyrrole methylase family protein/MazG family protein
VYDRAATFEDVYREITSSVIELATRDRGVTYAVPGHPLVGEATSREVLRQAAQRDLQVRVIDGISFLDVTLTALHLDPLEAGLLVLDALSLEPRRRLVVPQRPTIVAQVYDARAASQAKLALLDAYPPSHPVWLVTAAGTESQSVEETTVARLDHDRTFDHLTSLYIPPVAAVDDLRTFEGLRGIVARLRAPEGGCPWDLQQTHTTLKRYLLEEAYEALDALDEGAPGRIAEELGDLLMQIVLHAQVAEDNNEFAIEDVVAGIAAKLVRRHPHVFGDVVVSGASDVLRNWDELKREERGDVAVLDAVPKSMPALAQAQSVLGRATTAGLAPHRDAATEAIEALTAMSGQRADSATLGRLLFAVVSLSRERGLDAEEALRLAIRDFREEIATRERVADG